MWVRVCFWNCCVIVEVLVVVSYIRIWFGVEYSGIIGYINWSVSSEVCSWDSENLNYNIINIVVIIFVVVYGNSCWVNFCINRGECIGSSIGNVIVCLGKYIVVIIFGNGSSKWEGWKVSFEIDWSYSINIYCNGRVILGLIYKGVIVVVIRFCVYCNYFDFYYVVSYEVSYGEGVVYFIEVGYCIIGGVD